MTRSGKTDLRRVARAAGTSVATVSKVLNGYTDVSAATRARVLKIVKKLNYRPDVLSRAAAQRSPAGSRQYRIAVVSHRSLFISFDSFFGEVLKGIGLETQERGYQLLYELASSDREPPACIQDRSADGVLIVAHVGAGITPRVAERVPTVFVDQVSPVGDSLVPDYAQGARSAGQALVSAGHRKIAVLFGSRDPRSHCAHSLLAGVEEPLSAVGAPVPSHWITDKGHTMEGGYTIARRLLGAPEAERPTAIVTNDTGALGVYRAARELDLAVGKDISVVGCDGLPMGRFLVPRLATIETGPENLGREAVRMLIERLCSETPAGRKIVYSPVKFVPGESIHTVR
jgi:LacI family transcriptional regulator